MAWFALFAAGLFEIAWTVSLKQSHGFTRLWPSVFSVVTMSASFWLLSNAIRTIPLGAAYAVWTGVGTVGAVIAGMVAFGESTSASRLVCIALILAGVAGLRLTANP